MTLDEEDIAAIAATVAKLMTSPRAERATRGLTTASEVARALGVSRSWVYANKDRLGAIQLGTGPKARLRFDLTAAKAAFRSRLEQPKKDAAASPVRGSRPRTPAVPGGVELIKGRAHP